MASPSLTDYLLILITSGYIAKSHGQVFSVASTKYGPVRGVAVGNGSERIFIYRGIPYAKPPTGHLRLKSPEPPDSWSVTKDAILPSLDCMQSLRYGIHRNISEDCLYLNVFSPSSGSNTTRLPVMVWIFGGGFTMGSASVYDGSLLARKGVVVITLNYRLDAFGFLSTEDDVIPGNFGLLDQIFALKWVKENIANFGGDPDQVTIFGESAGACSVSILTLSPLTKGLFKRAIMESGSSLSPWCIYLPKSKLSARTLATKISSKVNCTISSSDQYLNCLQNVDAHQILQASYEVQQSSEFGMILLPRIEQIFGVLPALPSDLLEHGSYEHVDTIRGFNSNEAGALKENFTIGATPEEAKTMILQNLLGVFNLTDKETLVRQFEDVYLTNASDPTILLQRASDAITDFFYSAPAIEEMILMSKVASDKNHYFYQFNYRKSSSLLPIWATAGHADELYFVFGNFNNSFWGSNPPSQDDLLVSQQLITLWTNFAKTGNPTSSLPSGVTWWPAFDKDVDIRLLKIDKVSKVEIKDRLKAVELFKGLLPILENKVDNIVVGNLRLKRPQQPESWNTTKDALHQSYDCMQSPWFGLEKFGVHRNLSEDCLYLNVFSPLSGTNSTHLPVMVWIYGGGFNMGTSSPYDGTALAKKGVVVVTFNYRLDAFGFLSTEDDVIPGNFGLLDQIFALKWVKENIANFGGDPEKVTIFGESAGACSVSILTLSPLTKGLFKRVIMESGSVLSPWCVKYPTSTFPHNTIAGMVGSKVNCSVEPSDHYLQCLQSIDSKELLQASYDVQKASHVDLILTPRIEQVFNVLPDLPRRLLDSGHFEHVDSIRGFNSNELALLKENFTHGATLDEVKSDLLPIFLAYTKWPDKGSIVAQIEELYFKNVSDPILTLHRASDVISDFTFVFPALLESISAAGSARNRNNYVYEFSYRKSDSALPDWATSAHADEIIFVLEKATSQWLG